MTDDAPEEVDVLLVEDSPDVQRVMVKVLLEAGYTVHAVTDGIGALDQVAQHSYRAIACDLALPRMGGIAFFEELTKLSPAQAQRIIFISGSADSPDAVEFFKTHKQPLLEKPYSMKQFVRAISLLVGRPPNILS